MYDIDLTNVKKNRGSFIIFLVIGLLFASIGIGFFISSINKANKMDSEVEAYDVQITEEYDSEDGYMYSPIHYYTVDGVDYVCDSNSSSGSITDSMNDKTVYYNSNNPSECMTDFSKSTNNLISIIFTILGGIFAVIGFFNIVKIHKRIKVINNLNQNGKLVKNLPYTMEDTRVEVDNVRIFRPVINYTLPNGIVVQLKGDGRNDGKKSDQDGFVDLVIDPNDYNNYYIDFEINRIGGNLDSDYYKPNEPLINNSQPITIDSQITNNVQPITIDSQSVDNNQTTNVNNSNNSNNGFY